MGTVNSGGRRRRVWLENGETDFSRKVIGRNIQ